MIRFVLSIATALAFSAGMAFAQASPPPSAETQHSQGTEQTQSPGQPGMNQPGTYPQTSPAPEGNPDANHQTEKTEHRLKGCVEAQSSQFALKTRGGKDIALAGQDVSAHVGHEVELQGTWESSTGTGMSESSSGPASQKSFNVASVKMISDTCTAHSKGASGSGSSPSGNSTTPTQPQ